MHIKCISFLFDSFSKEITNLKFVSSARIQFSTYSTLNMPLNIFLGKIVSRVRGTRNTATRLSRFSDEMYIILQPSLRFVGMMVELKCNDKNRIEDHV